MENYKNPIVEAMAKKTLKEILESPSRGRGYSFSELEIGLPDIKDGYVVLDPCLIKVLHGFSGVAGYLTPTVDSSHLGYNVATSFKLSNIKIGDRLSNFFKVEEIVGKPTLLVSLPDNWKKLHPDIYRDLTPEIVEELITISDALTPLRELFQPVIPPEPGYIIVGEEDSPLQVKIWPKKKQLQILNKINICLDRDIKQYQWDTDYLKSVIESFNRSHLKALEEVVKALKDMVYKD